MTQPESLQNMSALNTKINQQFDYIRGDIMGLLRVNQFPPPSAADLSLMLQTVKSTADTTWILAEKQRLWAETEKIKAYTEQLKAETGKIKANTEQLKAETEKIRVQKL